ncbi:MAG TPA: zf-HC2 domain-containing protein, partial [Kofleriaceae bacterium]|nr:zf-HC2 domain-containing protein [Kofleriaceae bacterium]
MTSRCADLDEFFDGELAPDQADEFRGHLVGCERCQRMLLGRMQEDLAAHVDVGGVGHTVATPAPVGAVTEAPATAIGPSAATARTAVTPMRAPPRRGGLRRAAIYMG